MYKACLLFALAAICADAYKVLVVFPFPGKSHGILGEGVVRELTNAGHEVTYVTPFPTKTTHPKVKQIDVSPNIDIMEPLSIKQIMDKEDDMFDLKKFFNITLKIYRSTIGNENMQKMFNDPKQTFDVVIAEWMFGELYSGFAAIYGCPFIWLSTIEPHSDILSLIDEGLNPAYNPGIISDVAPPFSFKERVKELLFSVMSSLLKNLYFVQGEREEYESLFVPIIKRKGRPVPTYDELKYNVSLVLGNSHSSLGQATRLPQNYKAVGGYHIDVNVKPLPEDLKKLLDNAKNGLIYFSMGSNLKSKDLPDSLKKSLLEMFRGLKQTVLWKFEEVFPNLPSNVHIVQWAPQPSILAHPNCILFITHGGLLSTTEAVYFGKPVIGIPVFADQFVNAQRAATKGFGIRVDLSYEMTGELKAAIEEMVSNPSYADKAKELSFVYHDRPVPPGAELVHWVRHVAATRGALHLRSPALLVPFYQKMYLDLLALVLAALTVLYLAVRSVCKRCCGKQKNVTVSKNKKKKN